MEFEKKVADFIGEHSLVNSTERILLAVSGGADSTALLYAMHMLKTENILSADIVCTHMNHQLRGVDADMDEDFVIAQARGLNLPITTKHLDVRGFACKNKLSIETAARMLRIETLLNIAKENKCNSIATAHHKNDNAETILHRLVRGTGFRGLSGIWPARIFADDTRFVRPLLSVTRDEIIEYLNKRNLKWRRDHTNADCIYARNFIRHRLLPALQQDCSVSLVNQLSDLAASARKFYTKVCDLAQKAWPQLADCSANVLKLNLQTFLTYPIPVKVELVRRSLSAVGCGQRDLTRQHFKKILQLAEQNVGGRKIELPSGFVVRREYGNLIFARSEKTSHHEGLIEKSIPLQVPGRTKFSRFLIQADILEADESPIEKFKTEKNNCIESFDWDKIKLPLMVRSRKAGDRFWPLGLEAEKKIGKFLTAAKVPHHLRRKLLVIEDSEKIIWLWPLRIGEQAKVTDETQKVLQLRIIDQNQTK
ncbi:MAG: tRNA lysidine(34) synthetase TilS [Phycisphaerae bacterium]|nr:tRNA lysidine(34) synthetase TilS [Phycisphaerae bacterium]NIP54282.1 tRNA lysidine(34) synthetase TilS [Phycisphaerae bacterium]NIS53151.1 tRNA lysidine(34) synthetase TilS [Phycisphaerae bacterium]NIU10636.1 tRNA lysidine(34) synthetase TilS [Phycisphaerae bacterium]NIU58397.1 tRNA lysidine(34) synthetase TilS [Phycisphaerae bacterium]